MGKEISNLTIKRSLSIILFWLFIIYYFSSLIVITNVDVSAGSDQPLTITNTYTVIGTETWGKITVKGTGQLIVPTGTILNAGIINLESGSSVDISGGNVFLNTTTPTGHVSFSGECDYLKITDYAVIKLQGGNGWADTSGIGPYEDYIHISMGGETTFDVTVDKEVVFDNATIEVISGDGFDLPPSKTSDCYSWTNGDDLTGYTAAGGNAIINIELKNTSPKLIIKNSDLIAIGGAGGDAADGSNASKSEGGSGGGYSGGSGGGSSYSSGDSGGAVSGYVGAGGGGSIKFTAPSDISITNSNFSVLGGTGGVGGKGGAASSGAGWGHCGGGGGGYGGGGGGATYGDAAYGGKVSGYVGSGGGAEIGFVTQNNIKLLNSVLEAKAGSGGSAGDGGSGGSIADCGGGGFGGGGGGGFLGNGGDGRVYDYVGSGGVANISITGDASVLDSSIIYSKGGNGGDAGSGGAGTNCTAGGGGYGGGGGGNDDNELVGDGNAYDYVGSGGSTYLFITVTTGTIKDSDIIVSGGHGGNAGDGGDDGAAGGGGYGGGGGGSNAYGGNGLVSDYVGTGGKANCLLFADTFSIFDSELILSGGNGGDGGTGGTCGNPSHGAGGGGYAGCGGGGGGAYKGGKGTITGFVGDGGDASLGFYLENIILNSGSNLNVYGGIGGNAPNSPGGGDCGGEGTGRVTSNGTANLKVPEWSPILLSPTNNLTMNETPTMNWKLAEDLQINEYLKSYTVQIDNDFDFSSPVIHYSLKSTKFTPSIPLESGVYYWRVRANYKISNNNLNAWSEVWKFTILQDTPLLENFQKSTNMVYRNNTILININGSDFLDSESDLNCEIEYFPPTGPWIVFDEITYISSPDDGYWQAKFTPPKTAELGVYSVRVRFIDTDNNTGFWQADSFVVANNLPKVVDVRFSSIKIYRAEPFKMFINATDVETPESDLTCEIHFLSPTESWTFPSELNYVDDHWEISATPEINAELGYYDVLLNIIDSNGNYTGWITYEAVIEIKNNLPVILPSCDNFIVAATKKEFNLTDYGTDVEDPDEDLIWGIDFQSVNTALLTAILVGPSENILQIHPNLDASGSDDITLTLTDMDGSSVSMINITVHINRKPTELYGVSIRIIPESINITKGESENVTLVIKNIGLLPDEYRINIRSKKFSVFNINVTTKKVSLAKGKITHVIVNINVPKNTAASDYAIKFIVSSDTVSSDATLQLVVESKGDSNGSETNWFDAKNLAFLLIFIIIIFIVIMTLFQLLVRRKQKIALKKAFNRPDEFIEPHYGPDNTHSRLAPPPPRPPSLTPEPTPQQYGKPPEEHYPSPSGPSPPPLQYQQEYYRTPPAHLPPDGRPRPSSIHRAPPEAVYDEFNQH